MISFTKQQVTGVTNDFIHQATGSRNRESGMTKVTKLMDTGIPQTTLVTTLLDIGITNHYSNYTTGRICQERLQ